jgi:hypothetical protein
MNWWSFLAQKPLRSEWRAAAGRPPTAAGRIVYCTTVLAICQVVFLIFFTGARSQNVNRQIAQTFYENLCNFFYYFFHLPLDKIMLMVYTCIIK